MKISINWIKDYVDLSGIEVDELVKRFNLSTAEIEDVEHKGADIQNVVFGKIVKIDKHPETDHLHVMQVNVGDETIQILTSATNIYEGMVTAVCKVGGCVHGVKIKPTKMVGIESFGMMCSARELGVGDDGDNIVELDNETNIGTQYKC